MASRPTTIPQLDTSKTNRVAPTAGKIASGYVLNDLFPSSNANYLHGWAGDWHEWLQERSEDGATPGTDLTLRGLDALTATGNGGVLTLKGGDGGSTSGNGGNIILLPGSVTSGTVGKIGINEDAPLGTVHLKTSDAGSFTVNPSYDDLIVENNGWCGITIVHKADQGGTLAFTNTTGANRASLEYDATNDDVYLYHHGGHYISVDSSGAGINTTSPDSLFHVLAGSAGSVTATGGTVLTVENNNDCYISLLAPDANERGIWFGEASSPTTAAIIYNDAATPDGFQFRVNGNQTKASLSGAGDFSVIGQVIAAPVATNTSGVDGTGTGTGYGVKGTAGNDAASAGVYGVGSATINTPGVKALGGGTNGHGVYSEAKGSGNGVYGFGASGGTGNGVFGTANGSSGAGVKGQGFGVGTGVYGVAGNTAGAKGVDGVGGTGGGIGVQGTGTTSYSGVNGIGGPTSGSGVKGTGGTTNGLGVEGIGTGTNSGVKGTGGSSAGIGIEGVGGAGGAGVKGTGGSGSSRGVYGVGGSTNGDGVYGEGIGTGSGVVAYASGTGYGLVVQADTTSPARAAMRLIPQDTEPTVDETGALYVNTNGKLYIYNGTDWVVVGSQTT